jgi:hypothetical protein
MFSFFASEKESDKLKKIKAKCATIDVDIAAAEKKEAPVTGPVVSDSAAPAPAPSNEVKVGGKRRKSKKSKKAKKSKRSKSAKK